MATNYKVGWVIQGQLLGITHHFASLSNSDLSHIIAEAPLEQAEANYHIIIDHRTLDHAPSSLVELKAGSILGDMPPQLIMIVAPHLNLPLEDDGQTRQFYVPDLNIAAENLLMEAPELDWDHADLNFFPHG